MGKLGTYRTDVAMITDRQRDFLTSLTNEIFDLSEKITGEDLSDNREASLSKIPTIVKSAASSAISNAIASRDTLRQTARAQSYGSQRVEPAASATGDLDTDGIYIIDGAYYRVKRSGAGRLYALVLDTESRRWEYARGMVSRIRPSQRITAEDAAALPFSWCIRCGADLTRADSVARNMGPVCYSKSIG